LQSRKQKVRREAPEPVSDWKPVPVNVADFGGQLSFVSRHQSKLANVRCSQLFQNGGFVESVHRGLFALLKTNEFQGLEGLPSNCKRYWRLEPLMTGVHRVTNGSYFELLIALERLGQTKLALYLNGSVA
jgi:hypothetical protein